MKESQKNSDACYFYSEEGRIWPMCIKCHDEKHHVGMYWDKGFGHIYDVICHKCNSIIRKFEQKENK